MLWSFGIGSLEERQSCFFFFYVNVIWSELILVTLHIYMGLTLEFGMFLYMGLLIKEKPTKFTLKKNKIKLGSIRVDPNPSKRYILNPNPTLFRTRVNSGWPEYELTRTRSGSGRVAFYDTPRCQGPNVQRLRTSGTAFATNFFWDQTGEFEQVQGRYVKFTLLVMCKKRKKQEKKKKQEALEIENVWLK